MQWIRPIYLAPGFVLVKFWATKPTYLPQHFDILIGGLCSRIRAAEIIFTVRKVDRNLFEPRRP